jgi:hypothetical protein
MFYLSDAPHAAGASAGLSPAPHAAGASAGLSPAPHAAGASAGLSPAPHEPPQDDAASFLSHPKMFESAICLYLLMFFRLVIPLSVMFILTKISCIKKYAPFY